MDAVATRNTLARREWLLRTLAELRTLSPRASAMPAYPTITAQDFLDRHYAVNRPALLRGEVAGWPALRLWTPEYLKARIGAAEIEFQGGRGANENYERFKQRHRRRLPFDQFIDLITGKGVDNDAYVTAYNNRNNIAALQPLHADLGFIDHLLTRDVEHPHGMMWIGPAGTFTPLHHDLTNNLLVQITGSKRVLMVAPEEGPRLYNDHHVFSQVRDIEHVDLKRFPGMANLHAMRFDLKAGEALFIPIGWWHQVTAHDFSVSITYTNFRWRNDFHVGFPMK
ncbi:cupin-like domain-containing protein [Novosphingobium album (ex Liu et al. 2023)]|uniref:Cupin-like domain-containing protein n=1 Tax=Novosphingobium album (ex Liu et al. 2023) TaxID=3031130 RepID=A0ABT5WUQ0_9SPHN|nr:cupin-like domain-containing protein [Novosphingobium album (ex Liu et al. 2023)]MDE8653608.1 cupin-like domain-containing protein [Novosphingobium album (ex Liu et al. 2023)]